MKLIFYPHQFVDSRRPQKGDLIQYQEGKYARVTEIVWELKEQRSHMPEKFEPRIHAEQEDLPKGTITTLIEEADRLLKDAAKDI